MRVAVAYFPDRLELEIRNDAVASVLVGGEARRPAGGDLAGGGGHGLVGMRERAAMLGGSLEAGATEDGGFVVSAVLPVSSPASDSGEAGA